MRIFSRNDWTKAYDLKNDRAPFEPVGKAGQPGRDFSHVPLSRDWWKAIEDGRIPTHETCGVITNLRVTEPNDYPAFDLDTNGTKTEWFRYGTLDLYQVGREVRIEYVTERRRRSKRTEGESTRVLRVFVLVK